MTHPKIPFTFLQWLAISLSTTALVWTLPFPWWLIPAILFVILFAFS